MDRAEDSVDKKESKYPDVDKFIKRENWMKNKGYKLEVVNWGVELTKDGKQYKTFRNNDQTKAMAEANKHVDSMMKPVPVMGKGEMSVFKFSDGKYYAFDKYAKQKAEDLEAHAKKYGFKAYDTPEEALGIKIKKSLDNYIIERHELTKGGVGSGRHKVGLGFSFNGKKYYHEVPVQAYSKNAAKEMAIQHVENKLGNKIDLHHAHVESF